MQKALADVRDGKRCPLAGLFHLAVWQDQLNRGYMCLYHVTASEKASEDAAKLIEELGTDQRDLQGTLTLYNQQLVDMNSHGFH